MDEFVNVEAYREEIEEFMPHFVFYRRGFRAPELEGFGDFCESERDSKSTDCYCTYCHTRYEDTANKPSIYKHKTIGRCARCGATVEYRQMNRGMKTYYQTKNFAVFEGAGDFMRIDCIKAERTFHEGNLEPELDWYSVTRYQLQPGEAVQYWCTWVYEDQRYIWKPKKSKAKEPNFARGGFWLDRSYTLINHDCVGNSFLRYLFKEWDNELPSYYIQWLCRYAEHPQLEYLVHGGLSIFARHIVEDGLSKGIRLNWRTNDLKKMLKLDKTELEYLKEEDGRRYESYIRWRRYFWQGKDSAETIKYYSSFYNADSYIIECETLTGLSRKKIMDFALRKQNSQGTYFFLICYRDYLQECSQLQYDMRSSRVIMPKDVFAAHERTMKLLADLTDKKANELLAKTDEQRKDLEVVDMELGLELRLPRSIHEISQEGAKLDHCVGGYANRHAQGALTIMFLRTLSRPETPYYTMEVSNKLTIAQCRGYRNNCAGNPKPRIIEEFEERYTKYLEAVKAVRAKEKQKAKRKKKQQSVSTAA